MKKINNQIINKAINYIYENISESLSVDKVADYCGYSKYYLNRQFKDETGDSLYAFIKKTKLEQSALKLKIESTKTITDIGEEYGYSSSNYATVFKQRFDISPQKFRENCMDFLNGSDFMHTDSLIDFTTLQNNIRIEDVLPRFIIYERKKGNYHNLVNDWCDFTKKYEKYIDKNSRFIECTIGDPSITNPDECLYDIGFTIDKDSPLIKNQITLKNNQETLNTMIIPAGKYAIYRYKGYPADIYRTYQSILCNWFEKTGHEIDNRPAYDLYNEIHSDCFLDMDIYFPIK